MKGLDQLFVIAWMLFGILVTPLLFIACDFWAGTRKAKIRKEKIRSDKWQRTYAKIARYYNALLALMVVDIMHIAGAWYLNNYYEWRIPMFPIITLLGALGVAAIEIKSIFEKAGDKVRHEVEQVATLAAEIAKNKADPEEIARAVVAFINKDQDAGKGGGT
ncbi:MAG: phage holin family protein [Mediterranea sp.]|jgi:tellurite resistance protein|nr:phage holin family protein [Mediterranea sp.]